MINNDLISFSNGELSRNQLLGWINYHTKQGLTKIEQLGTGIAYCQIVDTIHPRLIPSSKMNFKAKSQYEFINNFKLLQQSFSKLGIYKNIDIEKLIKCKYQDNLQFLQWFYKYFESQIIRKDTLNSSGRNDSQNRSIPKRAPSFIISNNISKIQGRGTEPVSFENVLDDLGKPQITNSLQQLTEFYKSKLFEIQQLAQTWNPTQPSGELRDRINQILLRTPSQVVLKQIHANTQQ